MSRRWHQKYKGGIGFYFRTQGCARGAIGNLLTVRVCCVSSWHSIALAASRHHLSQMAEILMHADAPSGVTQEESHPPFSSSFCSACYNLNREGRVRQSHSLVDRELEYCVPATTTIAVTVSAVSITQCGHKTSRSCNFTPSFGTQIPKPTVRKFRGYQLMNHRGGIWVN